MKRHGEWSLEKYCFRKMWSPNITRQMWIMSPWSMVFILSNNTISRLKGSRFKYTNKIKKDYQIWSDDFWNYQNGRLDTWQQWNIWLCAPWLLKDQDFTGSCNSCESWLNKSRFWCNGWNSSHSSRRVGNHANSYSKNSSKWCSCWGRRNVYGFNTWKQLRVVWNC